MGVVHHATYISWLEIGRISWLETVGVPYSEVAASGHHFAVTSVQAEYRASCTFGDSVVIWTSLAQLRSRQVAFAYEIRHAIGAKLLVTGLTEHICVDLDGEMTRIPAQQLERLKQGAAQLTKSWRADDPH